MNLKLPQNDQLKTVEATGELVANKVADEFTKVSRSPPQIVQEQLELKQKILSMIKKHLKIYIYIYRYPEKRQQIINDLRLI